MLQVYPFQHTFLFRGGIFGYAVCHQDADIGSLQVEVGDDTSAVIHVPIDVLHFQAFALILQLHRFNQVKGVDVGVCQGHIVYFHLAFQQRHRLH